MTPSADGTRLDLRGVAKGFPGFVRRTPALLGASLSVGAGEIVGLVGPNGSGKSTLFLLALGYLRPDAGAVLLFGGDPQHPDARRLLGWVPEHPTFFPGDSGRSFLVGSLLAQGWRRSEASARAEELLEGYGLSDAARRPIRTYSRGMMQKVALASATAHRPRLLLLDEPTSGMDPMAILRVREEMRAFRAGGGSALVSSHQLNELTRICDRVLFLFRGEIRREERLSGCGAIRQYEIELEDAEAGEACLRALPGADLGGWERRPRGLLVSLAPGVPVSRIASALAPAGLLALRERDRDLEAIYSDLGGGAPC